MSKPLEMVVRYGVSASWQDVCQGSQSSMVDLGDKNKNSWTSIRFFGDVLCYLM